jgi:hypothetical protein
MPSSPFARRHLDLQEGTMTEQQQQPQPQWSPPPAPQSNWGGGGGVMPPQRPTGVTLGAIYLIVMGVLMALGGAACGLLGGAVGTIDPGSEMGGNPFAVFGGMIALIGIIILVLGIASIAAGAGALGGKGWARWTGIIVSVLMVLLSLLFIVGSLGSMDTPGATTNLVFWAVIGVFYALTAWAFVQANAYFARRV